MIDQQHDDLDRRSDALTAHFVKAEALRAAEITGTQASSLEAVLARISAQVTADAGARLLVTEQRAPRQSDTPESADDAGG